MSQINKKRMRSKKKPDWNDAITDLSIYKASPEELERKKMICKSKHAQTARMELLKKNSLKSKKSENLESQAALLKELLFESNKMLEKFDTSLDVGADKTELVKKQTHYVVKPVVTSAPKFSPKTSPNSSPKNQSTLDSPFSNSERHCKSDVTSSCMGESPRSDGNLDSPRRIQKNLRLRLPELAKENPSKLDDFAQLASALDRERRLRQDLICEIERQSIVLDELAKDVLEMKNSRSSSRYDDSKSSERSRSEKTSDDTTADESLTTSETSSKSRTPCANVRRGCFSLPDFRWITGFQRNGNGGGGAGEDQVFLAPNDPNLVQDVSKAAWSASSYEGCDIRETQTDRTDKTGKSSPGVEDVAAPKTVWLEALETTLPQALMLGLPQRCDRTEQENTYQTRREGTVSKEDPREWDDDAYARYCPAGEESRPAVTTPASGSQETIRSHVSRSDSSEKNFRRTSDGNVGANALDMEALLSKLEALQTQFLPSNASVKALQKTSGANSDEFLSAGSSARGIVC